MTHIIIILIWQIQKQAPFSSRPWPTRPDVGRISHKSQRTEMQAAVCFEYPKKHWKKMWELTNSFPFVCHKQGAGTHPGGSGTGFGARMASADHDHVVNLFGKAAIAHVAPARTERPQEVGRFYQHYVSLNYRPRVIMFKHLYKKSWKN